MTRASILLTLVLATAQHVFGDFTISAVALAEASTSQSNAVLSWATGSVQPSFANLTRLTGTTPSKVEMSVLLPLSIRSRSGDLNSTVIAFISCDARDYAGQMRPVDMYSFAVIAGVQAIILYSTGNTACAIGGTPPSGADQIYTTMSAVDSTRILADDATSTPSMLATIGMSAQNFDYGAYTKLTSVPQDSYKTLSGLNTKVAMIILYVVTAVVTVLFLFIIISGAVRLHRHPERYQSPFQPGTANGTRARGLGRAILDSLPIVKYNHPPATKGIDVELAPTTPDPDSGQIDTKSLKFDATHEKGIIEMETPPIPMTTPPTTNDTSSHINSEPPGTAAAMTHTSPTCSICTDDFELGQDLRVLPCDHKFHPACIDPWLLNVSGTCPLCRIDLHPVTSRSSAIGHPSHDLPPPLNVGSADAAATRTSLRRSLFGPAVVTYSDSGGASSNVAAPSTGRRDEVIATLRSWRREQQQQQRRQRPGGLERAGLRADGGIETAETEAGVELATEERRRRRLSIMFGVRTRRMT